MSYRAEWKREVIQPTQADSIRFKLDLVEWHPCYDTSKWHDSLVIYLFEIELLDCTAVGEYL